MGELDRDLLGAGHVAVGVEDQDRLEAGGLGGLDAVVAAQHDVAVGVADAQGDACEAAVAADVLHEVAEHLGAHEARVLLDEVELGHRDDREVVAGRERLVEAVERAVAHAARPGTLSACSLTG